MKLNDWKIKYIFAALVLCLCFLFTFTCQAEEEYIFLEGDGTYVIHNGADPAYVLGVNTDPTDWESNVELKYFTNGTNQMFQILRLENGYYRIVSVFNGKDLTVAGSTDDEYLNIVTTTYTGSASQQWSIVLSEDERYGIVSRLGSVLDNMDGALVDGNNVATYSWNGNMSSQLWDFEFISEETGRINMVEYTGVTAPGELENGNYILVLKDNTDLCLAGEGGISENGTPVEIQRQTDTGNQRFSINGVGDSISSYQIVEADSRMSLEIDGGSSLPGSNVMIWDFDGAPGQKWYFIPLGDACGLIQSSLGTVLGADSLTEGNNVYMVDMYSDRRLVVRLMPIA